MKKIYCSVLAVVAMCMVLRSLLTPEPIVFQDLGEASRCIKAVGFCVTSDRADGIIQSGFLVTEEQVGSIEANNLCKIGKMGPEWKGRVWVSQVSPAFYLGTVPDDAKPRTWGDLCAFGDPVLLDQIENKLQRIVTSTM